MTDPKPLVAPEIVPPDNTILFLPQRIADTSRGNFEVDIYMSGYTIEAEVTHTPTHTDNPSALILSERITLKPTLQAWLTDLLDRAEEAVAS